MRGIACIVLALLSVAVCVCWAAAPEPAIVPRPGQWTINTKFTHPQQILLRSAPENKPKRFWYSLITITNNTGRDVDFYPKCDLMTNTFEITPAGKGVTPAVFQNIKKRGREIGWNKTTVYDVQSKGGKMTFEKKQAPQQGPLRAMEEQGPFKPPEGPKVPGPPEPSPQPPGPDRQGPLKPLPPPEPGGPAKKPQGPLKDLPN